MPESEDGIIWAISNRRDDRVVLFERDNRHPGGEAFIGGPSPDRVARTGEVERLLHEGLIIEIPEPPDSRKKPIETPTVEGGVPSAQPGQPIKLGRQIDPELLPAAAQRKVQARQADLPDEIKSQAKVPPLPQGEQSEGKR